MFLDLSGEVTKCIVEVDKKNQQIVINTPMLGVPAQKISSLLNTPTLGRRSIANSMNHLQAMAGKKMDEKMYLNTPKPSAFNTRNNLSNDLLLPFRQITENSEASSQPKKSTFIKKEQLNAIRNLEGLSQDTPSKQEDSKFTFDDLKNT